jgi:hypothetical protein
MLRRLTGRETLLCHLYNAVGVIVELIHVTARCFTIVCNLSSLLLCFSYKERQCQTEAAAFFAAYNLGLPCFGFQPNALEAAVMVFESEKNKSQDSTSGKKDESTSKYKFSALDPLLSDAGVLKILIWLLAPVAMEKMKHAQLIASDPREASGFLKRLKEKAPALGYESQLDTLQINNDTETNDLLQWAYSEASTLIRGNQRVCDDLAQRLAGGASTVGDCIAVLEGW